ncbi:hypothetical protein [Desulfopila sp. IMCC35008]|uniref:hypothetical protein n=1 Tax=Desulfopila sp. IMCC35008 TaxID=2653858 RepID=UPI0013D2CC81|nr:hypothetical protein [Desulfopila sp. IMCC35008]
MDIGALGITLNGSYTRFSLYIGLAICVSILVGFITILTRMSRIRRECRETLAVRYDSGDIVCHDNLAHYLGIDSVQGKQIRAKGVLVLAQNELFFLRLHPRLELCIPLKKIKRIVNPTHFLDISASTPLLQIDFQEDEGTLSSVAWKIRDIASFTESLRAQRKKIQPKKKK